MDEREMTDEALLDLATSVGIPTDCNVSDGLLLKYARAAIDAARRTTPDREAIESAIREMQATTSPYSTQRECHVFDMTMALAINIVHRALKTAPTSSK